MEIYSFTSNIFQLINVSNKVFKLYHLSKPISQEQCKNILYELQHITITSQQIISEIFNKNEEILNIKYQLYQLFSKQNLASFQNDPIPPDKKKKPSQITISNLDTSLNSLTKKIQFINSQARNIVLELEMLIEKNKIPTHIVDKLNLFSLRELFKMLIKRQASTLRKNKFISIIKNMLVLQQMIILLLGQIYNQMKKICEQIKETDQINENSSTASQIKVKKSSLSISIHQYLENVESNHIILNRQSIDQKNPFDLKFSRSILTDKMNFNKKEKNKEVKGKEGCCFNI